MEPTDEPDVVRVTGLIEAAAGRGAEQPRRDRSLCARSGGLRGAGAHEAGRGGEIQLTDALQVLTDPSLPGGGMHAVVFDGRRYDTGDKLGYLKAVVELALARDDLGPGLREWLNEFLAD